MPECKLHLLALVTCGPQSNVTVSLRLSQCRAIQLVFAFWPSTNLRVCTHNTPLFLHREVAVVNPRWCSFVNLVVLYCKQQFGPLKVWGLEMHTHD